MNRVIKFRAWDGIRMTTTGIQFNNSNGELVFIPRGVLMQFTGLLDKNGVEIYEGDIFKTPPGWVAVVEWEKEGRFLGFAVDGGIIYVNREPYVEVIGNIYQNPELMEPK